MQCEHIQTAKEVLDIEIDALKRGRDSIDLAFGRVVELIRKKSNNGRVIVTGIGKSGHVGKKIAATLASTGTPAFFVHPAEAGHGDLGMITKSDTVIAISQSGDTDELVSLIPLLKRHNIPLIAMTGNKNSKLSLLSDFTLSTAVTKEACPLGLAPTSSTTLTLALGDALAVSLLKSRGFSKNDFALTHPSGSLGRKLFIKVNSVMRKAPDIPTIEQDVSVREAIVTMSSRELGFVIQIDSNRRPLGVFTDGDLRRTLERELDIKATRLSTVLKENFITIQEDQLAAEAVKLMEAHKISSLPVLNNDGQVIGALNMRLLLQAKIV